MDNCVIPINLFKISMRKGLFLFVFIFNLFLCTEACINSAYLHVKGYTIYYDGSRGDIPSGHKIETDSLPKVGKRLYKEWKATGNIDYLLDYGVVLIYQGQYEKARDIFISIEKTHPGRYATASNLGTAYELLGDDTSALKWIKRGIAINPQSHDGTEWLHVNILKAKINGGTYLCSDSLINANFGSEAMPKFSIEPPDLVHEWNTDIWYQLNERMTFIKGPDKIMGLLFFDLGNSLFLKKYNNKYKKDIPLTEVLELYDLAKQYGYSGPLFDKRYRLVQDIISGKFPRAGAPVVVPKTDYTLFYILGISTSILSIGIFFFLKRKTK